MSSPARFGFCTLRKRGDPDRRRQFLHAALERFQFHHRAELFQAVLVVGGRNLAVNRVAMRGGNFRQNTALRFSLSNFFKSSACL